MLESVARQVGGSAVLHEVPPDTPMSVGTLERALHVLQTTLTDRVGPAFLGDVLVRTDPATTAWREQVIRPEVDALADLLSHGVADGVLRADANYPLILELVLGGLVASGALHDGVPGTWARDLAVLLWPLIAAPPRTSERPRG